MNWQPIETVPHDGRWVRIKARWTPDEGELVYWSTTMPLAFGGDGGPVRGTVGIGLGYVPGGVWVSPSGIWCHEHDDSATWSPPPPVSSQDGE